MSDDSRGKNEEGKLLYCSFCGKSQHEVRKLIAGPSVFVCDECVELCNDIIREELEDADETGHDRLPKPQEIKAILDEYVIGQRRAKKVLSVAVSDASEPEVWTRPPVFAKQPLIRERFSSTVPPATVSPPPLPEFPVRLLVMTRLSVVYSQLVRQPVCLFTERIDWVQTLYWTL